MWKIQLKCFCLFVCFSPLNDLALLTFGTGFGCTPKTDEEREDKYFNMCNSIFFAKNPGSYKEKKTDAPAALLKKNDFSSWLVIQSSSSTLT